MPKVKMSDIKQGEKVKALFRRTISNRTESWMKKIEYNEAELLEILDLSENVEYHKEKRFFYQRLIQSQSKFSNKVFKAYVGNLFHVDALLNLVEGTDRLDTDDKLEFISYSMVTSASWFTFNFYAKGQGTNVGIDVLKSPFNYKYAGTIVRYMDKSGRGNVPKEYFVELERILDTMNEEDIMKWYKDDLVTLYAKKVIEILASYDKMPKSVIEHYLEKGGFSAREGLAMHPNCPPEIRQELYNNTKNEKYLTDDVKDVFLF